MNLDSIEQLGKTFGDLARQLDCGAGFTPRLPLAGDWERLEEYLEHNPTDEEAEAFGRGYRLAVTRCPECDGPLGTDADEAGCASCGRCPSCAPGDTGGSEYCDECRAERQGVAS